MSPSSTSFDAVVVGTGIAGLACALALARQGVRVSLLGPRPALAEPAPGHYDPRVYAISPASRQFLADLGVWGAIPEARVTSVQDMEIFGDQNGTVLLSAWQANISELASIVESTKLERALRSALQVYGVPWTQAKFTGLMRRPDTATLELLTDGSARLTTQLAVGADGAGSPLRESAGIATQLRDYDAIGLVVHLDAERPHQGRAWQWFTPDGILALLPMPDTGAGPQLSMVWSMRRAAAAELQALEPAELKLRLPRLLAAATGERLGQLVPRSPLHGFPLSLRTSSALIAPGIALVGDAAHVVHPLAGQGLNLGLGDAHALALAVGQREHYRNAGDLRVLRRYQRARAEPLTAMRWATDGLYHLFDIPTTPATWLRNMGMNLVERLPMVKRELIRRASEF